MGQPQNETEAMKHYDDARAWLSVLIDNPDKSIPVAAYKAQIRKAREAVAEAHKVMLASRG